MHLIVKKLFSRIWKNPIITRVYLWVASSCMVCMIGLSIMPIQAKIVMGIVCLVMAIYLMAFWVDKGVGINIKENAGEALLIESAVLLHYAHNVLHGNTPQIVLKLQGILPGNQMVDTKIALILLGILGCWFSFPAVCVFSKWFVNRVSVFKEIFCRYWKHLVLLAGLYGICLFAIVQADFYYIDDMGRAMEGYNLTGAFSRYAASFVAEILHGNSWLADISPLPQLVAIVIMVLAGGILLYTLSEDKTMPVWSVIALIPFGLSPYFLECLSYKYDAPYMALSVLVSIAPIVYRKNNPVKYMLAVFVGTLLMCTTYQVSSGVFPMLVCVIALTMWTKAEQLQTIGKFIVWSAGGYLAGLLVFRFLIMTPIESGESYVDVGISVSNILPNMTEYICHINQDFPLIWKALGILIVVLFFGKMVRETKQNRFLTAIVTVIAAMVMFALAFGVYVVFNDPLTGPRGMYGIGVLLSLYSIYILQEEKCFFERAVVACLGWFLITFSFVYGNALDLQKQYTDFRIEQVVNNLNTAGLLNEDKPLQYRIVGRIGYHPAVQNTAEEYPILERLVPLQFRDSSWPWGGYQFEHYYGLYAEVAKEGEYLLLEENLVSETYYYSMYRYDDVIVISLNDVTSSPKN